MNPFESTFSLLASLRDEIQDVRATVEELRLEKRERFKMVEEVLREHTGANAKRIDALEDETKKLKAAMREKNSQLDKAIADMSTKWGERFERIEAMYKTEVSDRFATTQALDKKLRSEVAVLRAHGEKLDRELNGHKTKVNATAVVHNRIHDDLRTDVEKFAALLADNSLSRDPFDFFGRSSVGHAALAGPEVSLGSTANGSPLPPLHKKGQAAAESKPISRPTSGEHTMRPTSASRLVSGML